MPGNQSSAKRQRGWGLVVEKLKVAIAQKQPKEQLEEKRSGVDEKSFGA